MDHMTLNFNNNLSTAVVFLEVKKAFDKTWHSGLLYKLSKLKLSISLIKLINSILSQRKFRVLVKDEISTPREILGRLSQGSFLPHTVYSVCIVMYRVVRMTKITGSGADDWIY
jgi:hypothetical protein